MPVRKPGKDYKKITVEIDGAYIIQGEVPLVRKTQVVTEHGEPIIWKNNGKIETFDEYSLCRCGHSCEKPFCDGTHIEIGFDGTETAETASTLERRQVLPGSNQLEVSLDPYLCMDSGFCANRFTDIEHLVPESDEDPNVCVQMISMIENCPSGAYTYALHPGESDKEPDLPRQIAVTTEITSEGPIMGPLWVTGDIPVERSDGKPFETRNRVTLCRCGLSSNKPLCDGSHRSHHITEDDPSEE
jgi:CDGSH-type Zn-finger protein